MSTVTLKGSERTPARGSRAIAPADPAERIEVSVIVRRRARQTFQTRVARLSSGQRAQEPLSRAEFAALHGADASDLAAVASFAASRGLEVAHQDVARRTVVLAGTVERFGAAFGVRLRRYSHPQGDYRGRTGAIHIPQELDGIVEAVLGLDGRPQAMPHFRLRAGPGGAMHTDGAPAPTAFAPTQVASLYGFPDATGKGQCVAIIELGGGYRTSDLQTYFDGLKVGAPRVTAVSVDHGRNAPTGKVDGPDGEVMLDIEMVGAIAPAANIVVYFAPNTDAGFLDAVTTAIHDDVNRPAVVSISWGASEASWTPQAMTAMDDAFQAAAALGVTVCVASGDNGSADGVPGRGAQVDFPASSPYALACGGTSLRATRHSITSEVVWNDGGAGGASGGGISSFFARPTWQAGRRITQSDGTSAALTRRGVPDVAGDADPYTGYTVRIDGTDTVIGGTSAVAPLWAALIARLNQNLGRPVGYLNPKLYHKPQMLRDITRGSNGQFEASAGWDACTGLGSPNGEALRAPL